MFQGKDIVLLWAFISFAVLKVVLLRVSVDKKYSWLDRKIEKDAMQFNASEQQTVPDAETTTESNYWIKSIANWGKQIKRNAYWSTKNNQSPTMMTNSYTQLTAEVFFFLVAYNILLLPSLAFTFLFTSTLTVFKLI